MESGGGAGGEREVTGQGISVPAAAAAPRDGAGVLDPATLDELRGIGSGDALLRRVFDLFRSNVPPALESVMTFACSGDRPALADAVHALKSMCTNIGACRAVAACHALEHAARTGAQFDGGQMADAIASEVRQAMAEVERLSGV